MHSINLDDQYEEDAARQRIEIVEGCSPVPEEPGLGVEVDEAVIARLVQRGPAETPRHLGKLRLLDRRVLYTASIPPIDALTGFAEGTIRGLSFAVWNDDGSEEFVRMYGGWKRRGRCWSEGVPMRSMIRVINANACPQFQYDLSRCQQLQRPKKSLWIQRYPSEQKIVQVNKKLCKMNKKLCK